MTDHNLTLEDRFQILEEIIEKMEDKDISLDDSFVLYKQGMDELKAASQMLDAVEKEIQILNDEGKLEDF